MGDKEDDEAMDALKARSGGRAMEDPLYRLMTEVFPPFTMDGLEVEVFTMPKGTIRYFSKDKAFRIYDGEEWLSLPWTFKRRMLVLGYRVRDSRFWGRVKRIKNLRHLRVTCSPKHECDCW